MTETTSPNGRGGTMTTQTAKQAYQTAVYDFNQELYRLDKKVTEHVRDHHRSPNWAHVGDLNRIAEALREIVEGK